METIKINMYVRLNCNYALGIGKTIGEIDEDNFIKTKFKDGFECSLPTYMIKKASHNIIDLIEVGDYVNGLPVRFVEEDRVDIGQTEDYFWLKNQHIQSIVTKEQMEAMEYKVVK